MRNPLLGRTVAVTRPRGQAVALASALEGAGARVLRMPALRIAAPSEPRAWRRAAGALSRGEYAWLVLTSPNAASAAARALRGRGLRGLRVVALGPGTAAAAAAAGVRVRRFPGVSGSRGLARALRPLRGALRGRRLLIPRSDIAPPWLPRALSRLGARVDAVVAYRTLPRPLSRAALRRLGEGRVDAVLFGSPSAVRSVAASCRAARVPLAGLTAVSIGPGTSQALRREGLRVAAEARPHTVPGLLRALQRVFDRPARPH